MVTQFLEEIGLSGTSCLADRIRLESADDLYSFTLKDGSLASVIRVDGAMRHEGQTGLSEVATALRVSLAPLLSRPDHALEFTISRDPATASRNVEQGIKRQMCRANALGLDLADILRGSSERLSRALIGETCLAVVYTRPSKSMSSEVNGTDNRCAEERFLSGNIQNPATEDMRARHSTFSDALCRNLHSCGRKASKLDVVAALQEIRASLYPFTAPWKEEWMPSLPLHIANRSPKSAHFITMPATLAEMAAHDFANLGTPPFDHQLAVENAAIRDSRTVRIGDTIFAGFDVTLAPEILKPFNELIAETMASPVPLSWRCKLLIEPGGLQAVRLKEQFARLFAFAAPMTNPRIRDAISTLRELDGAGDTIVRLRISFAIWAKSSQQDDLRRKLAIMQRTAEQWGNLSTDSISADPLATVLSTATGLGPESTAPVAAAPLSDALAMLPIARQASPWPDGPVTFRTFDGKAWPYWPGSSRQNSWAEIYCGTPGSGKSVAMHAINRCCILAQHAADSEVAELPYVAMLDIGRSAKGLVDLLREALPSHRRQEAIHIKLKMTPDHAINPFDTPLGLRRPLSAGRTFMINFLSILCGATDSSKGCPVTGLAGAALDAAFDSLSDERSPKRYLQGDSLEVDHTLSDLGIDTGVHSTWWSVADDLFAAGRIRDAAKAQARAVPVLSDLVAASQADHIAALYAESRIDASKESVIKAFHRRISEAIRDFRIMAAPSRFDVGESRITALDLEEVAGVQGGADATRKAALMYMLARQSLVGGWIHDDSEVVRATEVGTCPSQYCAYHLQRAKFSAQIPKLLCIDEFHRTGGLEGFNRQILQDIREGRKNNIRVALASQLPRDFGPDILDVASTLLIFDAPSESSAGYLAERLGLNELEKNILRSRLTGPTEGGAPFFAIIRHKKGISRQLLYLTLGPNELWALSTTPEDTALRDALSARLGPKAARSVLAVRFPSGSAKAEIENMAMRHSELRETESKSGIIESLINALIADTRLMTTQSSTEPDGSSFPTP